jgi:hypothetical protein
MKTQLGLAALLALSSCTMYRHEYVTTEGNKDSTSFSSFLMMGNASKIHSATKWTNYSRTVSVGSVEGKGDSELIQAITAGVVAGLKASQGVP